MKIVIIGNSSAAISCVEAIRKTDKNSTIILFSDEAHPTYSRPIISYLLAQTAGEHKIWFRAPDFYEKNNVEPQLGKKVVSILEKDKTIVLEDGEKVTFDKLCIATGGKPFVPNITGLTKQLDRVFTFTKRSDADNIARIKNSIKNVVIIGAGMIGTKAVEAITMLNIPVTLVELAGSVLCRALDSEASSLVETRMREKGITVIVNNEVKEIFSDENKIRQVILRDGTKIKCDTIIVAIGVVPNLDLTEDTSIKANRGIVVNEHMETSVKDIFAAGDVAEADEKIGGGKQSIPIWPLATRQGTIAGENMVSQGESNLYQSGFAMNSIEFCGVSTVSFGLTDVDDTAYEILKVSDKTKGIYKKIILKDDKIVGAIFVGDIEKAGIINTLIKNDVTVSPFKDDLLSDDFGYISFSRKFREEKLEKAV